MAKSGKKLEETCICPVSCSRKKFPENSSPPNARFTHKIIKWVLISYGVQFYNKEGKLSTLKFAVECDWNSKISRNVRKLGVFWISMKLLEPKALEEPQGCRMVRTLSFLLFRRLRFWSFKAGITRNHNLEKTRFLTQWNLGFGVWSLEWEWGRV